MKKIIINGTEYLLYGAGENPAVSNYPHMEAVDSGKVPEGKQRSLLKAFLQANGVKPVKDANTHWYVMAAMKLENIKNEAVLDTKAKKQPLKIVQKTKSTDVPKPSEEQIEYYLRRWEGMEKTRLHEEALDKLFLKLAPDNTDISDILLKTSTLNDFYSTNIFSVYQVAKHILTLNIDARLKAGDVTLVNDIKKTTINGVEKNFYSFATKYCSHHNPLDYPIYDSYVDKILCYFRDTDGFSDFTKDELKDYVHFKGALIDFRKYYGLEKYNLKQIDKYLWQLGKEYFPKNYGKK